MDEETHTFAVETTAQIEVLTSAVVLLVSQLLRPLAPEDREKVLSTFVATASEVPPGAPLPTPGATRMFEAIAEAIPHHAERFAAEVRQALKD